MLVSPLAAPFSAWKNPASGIGLSGCRCVIIAVIAISLCFCSRSFAQLPDESNAPPVVPAQPLFDWPLVASSAWPNSAYHPSFSVGSVGATCQLPVRPVRNCSRFKLVYANSYSTEPHGRARLPMILSAALVIQRPGREAVVRQVTFHGGNPQVALPPESVIVSDAIPEYWDVREGATAFIRTCARMPAAGDPVPTFFYISPLYGVGARWREGDATLAPGSAAFASAPTNQYALYPVAILGDSDPSLPSVALIGSSNSSSFNSYPAQALLRENVPFVMLATPA